MPWCTRLSYSDYLNLSQLWLKESLIFPDIVHRRKRKKQTHIVKRTPIQESLGLFCWMSTLSMDKKYADIPKAKMFWSQNGPKTVPSHSHTQTLHPYTWSPPAVSQGLLSLLVARHNTAACSEQYSCAHIKTALTYALHNLTIKSELDFQTNSYCFVLLF